MDSKITLSFDTGVIEKAKQYAEENNISLSRLTEFVFNEIVSNNYKFLDGFPIADWVKQVSEGEAVYLRKARTRKETKKKYFESRR